MRTRREQISNADSPAKPYFEGELGMTARQVSPFTVRNIRHAWRLLAPLIDPSARPSAAGFVDSQPNIRRFVYGVWTSDMMIQAIAGGLSGGSAWDLDDAMHTGGQYGSQNLKRWGFWNSLGGQDGYPASDLNPRPWFYSWSVLARSFPAGSQPLLIPTTGVGGLRMAAAKIPVGQRYALSFALVNDSGRRRAVTLRMPAAAEPISLARYDYFSGDRPVDANGFAVPVRNIRGARLSSGLTVTLPSRGLVVLSSVATGDAVALREGTHMLLDALGNWHAVAAHSKGLKLDHSARQRFDDDRSRAAARSTGTQSLVYRVGPLTSFKLKAYYRGALGLRVYVSGGRGSWRPIGLESTNPAPALAGHGWYLAELLPAAALPSGAMRLKVELLNRQTELGQASIEYR
jgi:hypothetical protein